MQINYDIRTFLKKRESFEAEVYQYWIILSGNGQIDENNRTICLAPHDVLEIPKGYKLVVNCQSELSVARILLPNLANANTRLQKKGHQDTELIRRVYFFAMEFKELPGDAVPRMMYHVDQLMYDALSQTGMENYIINPEIGRIIGEMSLHFMEADYDYRRDFRSDLYSMSHLRQLFHQETGYGPSAWINRRRIDQAKYLLRQTPKLMVKEVAGMCGFEDAYYFSRLFRKYEGQSPREYQGQTEA